MRRIRELITIIGLLIIIIAFYSSNFRHTMQCDEVNTLYKYAINPISALFAYTTPNNHLIHSLGVWLTTSLMGYSHIAVRYTAFMASILTFAMAYHVGRKTLNHYAGLASIALLGISLGMAGYTVDARGYTLSTFLTLILIDLIFLSGNRRSRRRNYAIILVSYLLLMVLPSMVLVLFPVLIWKLWQNNKTRSKQHLTDMIGICVGGISAFLFYLPSILSGAALEHLGKFGEPSVSVLLSQWVNLLYTPFSLGAISLIATGIGFAFLIIKSHQPKLLIGIVLILATAFGVAVLQYALTGRTLYARNYFYLLPIMTLLGGIGLSAILRHWVIPIAFGMILVMSITAPPIPEAIAIDQLIRAIPQYQTETELFPNHVCHITAAFYELTETQQKDVNIWSPDSSATSVMIPIPLEFEMSLERAIIDNGYSVDQFSECQLIEDDAFDWLDIYTCKPT
jgi:hypothetical protein